MKLTLLDRLILVNALPSKGTFEYLIVREDIGKKVSVTQDELVKYEIRQSDDGNLKWKQNDDEFDFEFTAMETEEIRKALKSLSERGEASPDHLSLHRKFSD